MIIFSLVLLFIALCLEYEIRVLEKQVDKNEEKIEEIVDIVEYKTLVEMKIVKLAQKYNVYIALKSELQLINGKLTISKRLKVGEEWKMNLTQHSYSYIYVTIGDMISEILEGE